MVILNRFNIKSFNPKKGETYFVSKFLFFPKTMRLPYSEEFETRWLQNATFMVIYNCDRFNLPGGFVREKLVGVENCWVDDRDVNEEIKELPLLKRLLLTYVRLSPKQRKPVHVY
jgi:hypothetical protein